MALPKDSEASLSPLITSIATATHHRVSELENAARATVKRTEESAARDCSAIAAEAEAAGTLDAQAAAALTSAHTRRTASELELATQEALRTELRERVHAEAIALRSHAEYPRILERLTHRAHRLLGPDAIVTENADGGVTAVAHSRSVDLTLPTLAVRTFDEMAAELSELWQT